ncbi:LysR family transcriptional regulator [Mesorhizobium sp. ArgA1]
MMTGAPPTTPQRSATWRSLQLTTLHCALIAAEEGSFLGASRRLAMHHSALSRRIKHLELRLGVALFKRHPGGVQPTAIGDRFLTRVRRTLADLEDALAGVDTARSQKTDEPVRICNAALANAGLSVPASYSQAAIRSWLLAWRLTRNDVRADFRRGNAWGD